METLTFLNERIIRSCPVNLGYNNIIVKTVATCASPCLICSSFPVYIYMKPSIWQSYCAICRVMHCFFRLRPAKNRGNGKIEDKESTCFMFYLTTFYVCGPRHAMYYRTVLLILADARVFKGRHGGITELTN